MTPNEEFDKDPAPELRYVGWRGHPFQVRDRFGEQTRHAWANSADRDAADVVECRTFKLKNMEGDIYLFTPDPFDWDNVWVRNKGTKQSLTTVAARTLWKELITNKGYMQLN